MNDRLSSPTQSESIGKVISDLPAAAKELARDAVETAIWACQQFEYLCEKAGPKLVEFVDKVGDSIGSGSVSDLMARIGLARVEDEFRLKATFLKEEFRTRVLGEPPSHPPERLESREPSDYTSIQEIINDKWGTNHSRHSDLGSIIRQPDIPEGQRVAAARALRQFEGSNPVETFYWKTDLVTRTTSDPNAPGLDEAMAEILLQANQSLDKMTKNPHPTNGQQPVRERQLAIQSDSVIKGLAHGEGARRVTQEIIGKMADLDPAANEHLAHQSFLLIFDQLETGFGGSTETVKAGTEAKRTAVQTILRLADVRETLTAYAVLSNANNPEIGTNFKFTLQNEVEQEAMRQVGFIFANRKEELTKAGYETLYGRHHPEETLVRLVAEAWKNNPRLENTALETLRQYSQSFGYDLNLFSAFERVGSGNISAENRAEALTLMRQAVEATRQRGKSGDGWLADKAEEVLNNF